MRGLLIIAGAACLLGGCGRSSRPNVLLITMDTTRADRLSCYGYTNAVTPNLQRLANEGIVIEQAQSCVPLTLPSHATLLTGLIPPEHGVRVNGANALPEEVPVLQEILKARGYRTGAVIASPIMSKVYGLNRGFDLYDTEGIEKDDKELMERLGFKEELSYRSGKEITDAALHWLAGLQASRSWPERLFKRSKPWFLWAHYYDPHHPNISLHTDVFGERFKNEYDAEVAYMDQHIGRLLSERHKAGQHENTLIIAVADHGEGLGDNGEATHGFFIYQQTQHVPLILQWTGVLPAGKRIPAYIGLECLTPTVLELLKVKPDIYRPKADERNAALRKRVAERSVAAGLRSGELSSRPCYMETVWPYSEYKWAPLFGLIEEQFKFIRAPTPELYDFRERAVERANVYTQNVRRADEMAISLEAWEKRIARPSLKALSLTEQQVSQLQSLGYAAGNASLLTNDLSRLKGLCDTKDIKTTVDLVCEVRGNMIHQISAPETLAACKKLISLKPDVGEFHAWLGTLCEKQGDKAGALAAFEEARRLDPENADILSTYAEILLATNRYEEAVVQFEAAYRLEPQSERIRETFAKALGFIAMHEVEKQKLSSYETYCRRALELCPEKADAHFMVGRIHLLAGKRQEALRYYKRAAELKPNDPEMKEALRALRGLIGGT